MSGLSVETKKGLTTEQAKELQQQFGKNELVPKKKEGFILKMFRVVCEPMFLLLIAASVVYFILGEPKDGAIMLIFVVAVIGIEVIQEWRTDKTLAALKDLSAPRITVLRDGEEQIINSTDLVPGDIMLVVEGLKVPADGIVLKASTLLVDESSLTGESEGVWKLTSEEVEPDSNDYWRRDYCYAGTLVTQGTGTILVDKIGSATEYGKICKDVVTAPSIQTPLQQQTEKMVKSFGAFAMVLFALVGIATYFDLSDHMLKDRVIESILAGITLAMAMIPEEFPVILTVFLSMGAWRLAKKQSLVRKLPSVETLGAVSVLCVDKTGTITMNRMKVQNIWNPAGDDKKFDKVMGMACKTDAYDPMEKAMIVFCEEQGITAEELFGNELVKEYPFTNETKMMGNVWAQDGKFLVAAKGSPERILQLCELTQSELMHTENKINTMAERGLRVIAVGEMDISNINDIPESLVECKLRFCGVVGLADPPRDSVKQDVETCIKAGVRVVMITGDNGITASAIARQIGMADYDKIITGDDIDKMSQVELKEKIKNVSIFSRVIPEHKMRIVQAFKANGEIVAMTGDGVNDAPALKYADIGIAMGKRGSEVAREAADLILLDDNFSTIVDTIKDGRRIYDNIKRAFGYVIVIHIPIAFSALVAPLLGISPVCLFLLPVHVVLLELVIDPTCSIVLERQPAEMDVMERLPRKTDEKIIDINSLTKSLFQGFAIFGAAFGTYLTFLTQCPDNGALARTMGLTIIFIANMLLVHVNSSESEFAIQSILRLRGDKVIAAVNIGVILSLIIMLYTPVAEALKLAPLTWQQIVLAVGIACASVLWYELVKLVRFSLRSKEK
ncbi:MAG: cation-translocating P-type ATPase [Acholeplasmataceae bacterium]|nr:cation-translocating P-type ATPase [Acholeplasmataceae bacterium]